MQQELQFKEEKDTRFSEEEHETWSLLSHRMTELFQDLACKEFLEGMEKIDLNKEFIPSLESLNQKLNDLSNWNLVLAENQYLDEEEWGVHMTKGTWPMTDFIRSRDKQERVDAPDVFHDFFGHCPQLVQETLLDITNRFRELYSLASAEEEFLQVSRLWWHTLEFGLIKEEGEAKVCGAFTSEEMIMKTQKPGMQRPFDFETVIETEGGDYNLEKPFFVLESWEQLFEAIEELKKRIR